MQTVRSRTSAIGVRRRAARVEVVVEWVVVERERLGVLDRESFPFAVVGVASRHSRDVRVVGFGHDFGRAGRSCAT